MTANLWPVRTPMPPNPNDVAADAEIKAMGIGVPDEVDR